MLIACYPNRARLPFTRSVKGQETVGVTAWQPLPHGRGSVQIGDSNPDTLHEGVAGGGPYPDRLEASDRQPEIITVDGASVG